MPVFAYEAVDSSARDFSGTIAADTPREARDKLRAQGYRVEALSEKSSKATGHRRLLERPGRHAAQLTAVIRDLATLLGTGINLSDALDTLTAQHKGRLQTSLLALRERVTGGSSLSEAMRSEPGLYDELTLQMVPLISRTRFTSHTGSPCIASRIEPRITMDLWSLHPVSWHCRTGMNPTESCFITTAQSSSAAPLPPSRG
jgi:Type II secretion system (T2SS), protein F